MSRLVDADELIKSAPTELGVPIWQIEDAPTVDAVEVVRCKDCKWRGGIGCAVYIVDESDKPEDDDFCSWGERREDDKSIRA